MNNSQPFVIGIAGGSGSGKTTVAQKIMAAVPQGKAVMIAHDNYYKDLSHMPEPERINVNFDHPDSLESSLLARHLDELKHSQPIDEPTYDFVHHMRRAETIRIESTRVVMVEGILVLASRELLPYFDLKIFVDTDADIRFIRRLDRDMRERGRTLAQVVEQYQKTVKPMHLEFVEPSKRAADVIIPEGANMMALDLVITKVTSLL